jgi:hypothetical protein
MADIWDDKYPYFIKNEYIDLFPEILDNIEDIYVEQGVRFKSVGGETSPKTLKILSNY